MAGVLNPIVRTIGSFPLAVLTSVLMAALVIIIWNLLAIALGTPLEIFYLVVAVAAGIGLGIISEHRGKMMGLLAVFMAMLAIISARIVQTHLFVFSEWKKHIAAVDIPPQRERLYLMMNQFLDARTRTETQKNIAADNLNLAATAIAALIQEGRLEPALGQNLYLAARSQLNYQEQPYDPNGVGLTFAEPALSQAWPAVNEQLRQWDDDEKRFAAAGRYHFRRLFLIEQCRYKAILDDYPRALTIGFFVVDGCVFLFLRVVYCLVGLIGAYKSGSESFMD